MTKRIQPYVQSLGALALVAQVLIFQACSSSNSPSTIGGSGGSSSGTGGSTATGTGGSTAAGTGGSTAAGGSTGAFGEPACLSVVVKGGACTAADQQSCYKTCGPEKTGVKLETCQTSGTYAEMSGCTFDPTKNYACYKIPTAANTACPAGVTPQGSAACDVPHCTLCNSLQGMTGGNYLDSAGAPKVGWCTCQEPNTAGVRSWTCASDTAWPCPLGSGC